MTYLLILFVPPVYFLTRGKWGGFILNSIICLVGILMICTIVFAVVSPLFWMLAVGHAAFAYRREQMEEHANLIATKMAEKLQPPRIN